MDQKPANGKMPARLAAEMTNVQKVLGMTFRRPPMSSTMSKLWWQAWLSEPAPRNRLALKKACVNRWNIAAVQAPTPSAATMKPNWEMVEYARTFLMSFCTNPNSAPKTAVTEPTRASMLNEPPAIDRPSKNTGYSRATM